MLICFPTVFIDLYIFSKISECHLSRFKNEIQCESWVINYFNNGSDWAILKLMWTTEPIKTDLLKKIIKHLIIIITE